METVCRLLLKASLPVICFFLFWNIATIVWRRSIEENVTLGCIDVKSISGVYRTFSIRLLSVRLLIGSTWKLHQWSKMDWCFSWYNRYFHGNFKTTQIKIGETWVLRRPHVISSSKYQYLKVSWQVHRQYRFDFGEVAKTFQINCAICITTIDKTTVERYFDDTVSNNTKMLSWSHESFVGVFRDLKKKTLVHRFHGNIDLIENALYWPENQYRGTF